MCSWFVIKSEAMHGKCKILRFTIIIFRVMRPCNLTGGYQGFIADILPPCSDGL